MFISLDQLHLSVDDNTKHRLIHSVESYFCGLLPLEQKNRILQFYPDEVYIVGRWYKIYTPLVNISAVLCKKKEIPFKVVGDGCQELLIASDTELQFDPALELEIVSGYNMNNLPGDIRQLMLDLITTQSRLEDGKQEKSIKMGPREVEYAPDIAYKKLLTTHEQLKERFTTLLTRYTL